MVKLGLPSVISHVKKLEKEGFVRKEKKGVYAGYKAERNDLFKLYKKTNMLLRLTESGLLDFLVEKFSPDAVVLFGSASRGEDIETSDIDLFILAHEEDVSLRPYEKKLHRKINLFFEAKLEDVPKELLNNLINGIVLHGYLKVLK